MPPLLGSMSSFRPSGNGDSSIPAVYLHIFDRFGGNPFAMGESGIAAREQSNLEISEHSGIVIVRVSNGAHEIWSLLGMVGSASGLLGNLIPHESTVSRVTENYSVALDRALGFMEPVSIAVPIDISALGRDLSADRLPDQIAYDVFGFCVAMWIVNKSSLTGISTALSTNFALILDGHHRIEAFKNQDRGGVTDLLFCSFFDANDDCEVVGVNGINLRREGYVLPACRSRPAFVPESLPPFLYDPMFEMTEWMSIPSLWSLISQKDQLFPPKSTRFFPKPNLGLVFPRYR